MLVVIIIAGIIACPDTCRRLLLALTHAGCHYYWHWHQQLSLFYTHILFSVSPCPIFSKPQQSKQGKVVHYKPYTVKQHPINWLCQQMCHILCLIPTRQVAGGSVRHHIFFSALRGRCFQMLTTVGVFFMSIDTSVRDIVTYFWLLTLYASNVLNLQKKKLQAGRLSITVETFLQ